MNADRDFVEGTIVDFDADELIKQRDLEKMSINEKQVAIKTGALACGRKYDELLLDELQTSTNIDGAADADIRNPTITLDSASRITGIQRGMGKIYIAVPQLIMTNYMMYEQFASAGWNGDPAVAKLTTARSWMGINYFVMEDEFFTSRRPATGTNNIYLYVWHQDCVGRVDQGMNFEGISTARITRTGA